MNAFDPIRELQSLRREVDQLFPEGVSRWPRSQAFLPGRSARQYPLMNVYDDGRAFHAEALMPGVDAGNLEVTVVGNSLTLAGQKPGFGEIEADRIHRTERSAGRFIRTIQLPVEIDRDSVSAEYRQGILTLTLPRSQSAMPRRINIQAGDTQSREPSIQVGQSQNQPQIRPNQ